MSVYKLANGKWRVQVNTGYDPFTGKPVVEGRSNHTTKKSALDEERALKNKHDMLDGYTDRVLFSNYVEYKYLPSKQGVIRDSTYRVYKNRIGNYLLPYFGDMFIGQIRRSDVQMFLKTQKTRTQAKNLRDLLRAIFNSAVDDKMLSDNPAKGNFRLPDVIEEKRELGEVISDFSKQDAIFDTLKGAGPLEIMVLLCMGVGLRKGEALAANIEDIDFKNCVVRVNKTYTQGMVKPRLTPPKTNKANRTVFVRKSVMERLKKALTSSCLIFNKKAPAVRKHADDNSHISPSTIDNHLASFKKRNEDFPNITFLSCRHSYGTANAKAGMDIFLLAQLMGHENVSTTYKNYIRPTENDVKESVDEVETRHQNRV